METGWLRRRPSRCTGDKFVCVSWAATLSSRTLTRSCQWEGRSQPSTSFCSFASMMTPPPHHHHLLHPHPTVSMSGFPCICPGWGYREDRPLLRHIFPLGSCIPALHNTLRCRAEVSPHLTYTQSKPRQTYNRSPRELPLSHGKKMDRTVWQALRQRRQALMKTPSFVLNQRFFSLFWGVLLSLKGFWRKLLGWKCEWFVMSAGGMKWWLWEKLPKFVLSKFLGCLFFSCDTNVEQDFFLSEDINSEKAISDKRLIKS